MRAVTGYRATKIAICHGHGHAKRTGPDMRGDMHRVTRMPRRRRHVDKPEAVARRVKIPIRIVVVMHGQGKRP